MIWEHAAAVTGQGQQGSEEKVISRSKLKINFECIRKPFFLRKVQRTSKRYVQRMLKCCARDMQDVFGMCKECSKDVQGMIYRFFIRTCKEYMCKK